MTLNKTSIIIPIWERELIIMFGGKFSDLEKEAAKVSKIKSAITHESSARGGSYFCHKTGTGILWFPVKKIDTDTLTHEITHIIDELFKYIGAENESEARAYTAGWIASKLKEFR